MTATGLPNGGLHRARYRCAVTQVVVRGGLNTELSCASHQQRLKPPEQFLECEWLVAPYTLNEFLVTPTCARLTARSPFREP
jgi:hypothetical protein